MHAQQACSHRSRSSMFASPNVSIGRSLTLHRLVQFCSDPKRASIGNIDVRAVLAFSPTDGFYLWAQDGPFMHPIVDGLCQQIRYRTIETALADLRDIAGLSAEIAVVQFASEPEADRALEREH